MIKRLKLFLLGLFVSIISHTSGQVSYENVDASTFSNLIEQGGGLLLDVRTPGEYSRGHIAGSTLIDIADPGAANKINMLQKNKPVYVYCLTGSRSQVVANYMVQNGFDKVYNLQRGIVEWHQMSLPIVQGEQVVASESRVYQQTDMEQLLKTNSLVLVNFHAPWCAPCKKMAPDIERLSQQLSGKAMVAKVDVDVNKQLQKSFGVESIPGLVLYKEGKEVWRHAGLISYDDLMKVMASYV